MSNVLFVMGQASATIPREKFVGVASNVGNNGTSVTVDLSAIDVRAGDMILAGYSLGRTTDYRTFMTLDSTGYTEITSLYGNDTYDINMKVFGKIADGSESSFVTTGGLINTSSCTVFVSVFRYTNGILPTTLGTGLAASGVNTNTDDVVWPSVSGLAPEDVLVYFGSVGHQSGTTPFTDPTDLLEFETRSGNDTEDCTGGFGYKLVDLDTSFAANTWATATLAPTASSVAYTILKI